VFIHSFIPSSGKYKHKKRGEEKKLYSTKTAIPTKHPVSKHIVAYN
jgi:hypothetical protein